MTNAESLRHYRELARARGKCGECRKRHAEPDLHTCRVCLDRHAEVALRRKDRGLCKCGREPERGYRSCKVCRDSTRARVNARYHEAAALKLCTLCMVAVAEDGFRRCRPCLDAEAKRVRKYRRAG